MLDVRGAFNRDFYGTEIGLPDLMPGDIFDTKTNQKYLSAQQQLPGLNREARYNNESDFMKNHAWNVTAQYTHTFDNGFKLIDKLAYYNDDINYFGTEALDYLESEDPIYDHYYMKSGKKKYICLDTVYLSYPLRFSHISKTVSNSLELSGKLNTGEVTHNFIGGYSFSLMNRVSYTGYGQGTDVQGPGWQSHVSVYDPHSMGYMTSKMSKAIPSHNYSNSIYVQDMLDINEHWKALVAPAAISSVICKPMLRHRQENGNMTMQTAQFTTACIMPRSPIASEPFTYLVRILPSMLHSLPSSSRSVHSIRTT